MAAVLLPFPGRGGSWLEGEGRGMGKVVEVREEEGSGERREERREVEEVTESRIEVVVESRIDIFAAVWFEKESGKHNLALD